MYLKLKNEFPNISRLPLYTVGLSDVYMEAHRAADGTAGLGLVVENSSLLGILSPREEIELEHLKLIDYNNLNSEWIAGFATGEANFFIAVQKSKNNLGITTSLRFSISQARSDSRDINLLKSLEKYFGGGSVMNYKSRPSQRNLGEFIIKKIVDLT